MNTPPMNTFTKISTEIDVVDLVEQIMVRPGPGQSYRFNGLPTLEEAVIRLIPDFDKLDNDTKYQLLSELATALRLPMMCTVGAEKEQRTSHRIKTASGKWIDSFL